MKITITQIVIDQHAAGPQSSPSPSDGRPRKDTDLAGLLLELFQIEESDKPQRKTWETDPYGTIFKI